MGFYIKIKNGKQYRININKTGNCKHYPDIPCVCCDPKCDHNVAIDDEAAEVMDRIFDSMYL